MLGLPLPREQPPVEAPMAAADIFTDRSAVSESQEIAGKVIGFCVDQADADISSDDFKEVSAIASEVMAPAIIEEAPESVYSYDSVANQVISFAAAQAAMDASSSGSRNIGSQFSSVMSDPLFPMVGGE